MGRPVAVALLTLLIAQWVLSTLVSAETIIIPTLSVAERYDSNIFFTPKSLLSPDRKPEDFITAVIPQINIARAGSLMRGRLAMGALVSRYLHNPDLDFVGYNAAGQLDLKDVANKVSQRIRSLSVNGTYQFSPSATGFGAAGGGLGTTAFGSTSGGPLDSGLVTNRTLAHRYTLNLIGGYQLTRTTTLSAGYNYSQILFGEQSGGVNNFLFNTSSHRGLTGISTQISARDRVGASAMMSHFIQGQSSGGSGQGSFTTISETLNWSRLWTQELRTSLSGGGIVTLPIGSSIPGQSVKSQFAPTGTAEVIYSSFSAGERAAGYTPGPFASLPVLAGGLNPAVIMPPGAYSASMRYTYSIFPNIAFGSGPTRVHVVGANAGLGITPNLAGQVGMNYAHGSSPDRTYDTLGVTAGASYLIGPVLASLSYNWLYFSNSTDQLFSGQSSEYSKKIVMLSLSYAFTSQSFFRTGGLGSLGTQGPVEGISAPSGAGTGSSPSGDGS